MTAAYAWGGWLLINIVYLVPADLWLKLTGRHTMTRQMHDWVFHSQAAQFIIPGASALLIWFIVHEVIYHVRTP